MGAGLQSVEPPQPGHRHYCFWDSLGLELPFTYDLAMVLQVLRTGEYPPRSQTLFGHEE